MFQRVCAAALGLAAATALGFQPLTVRAAPVPTTTCSVFPTDNIWNTDISSLPVNSHSAAWLNSTGANSGRLLHPDFGGPPYGIPFNVVDNSHPTTNFTFQYASESDPGPYPYGSDLQIEQGSDAHMLTINRDTCKLYETFATNYAGAGTAGSGAIFDLSSNQLRPAGWTSADAAGLPIFPGLIRLDEVAAGFIGHAIRFTVQQSDQSYLWPARHQAGSASDPNLPPMGARFRLKSSYNISAFSAPTQVVLTAMKHYGLIVADNGSNWFFQGTEDAGWNGGPYPQMIAELKTIPANQFEAVDESSLMVDPNSGQAGVPLAPTAVNATPSDQAANVSWTAPSSAGSSPITAYVITAYDGCTVQGSLTVSGSPPATTVVFSGLNNGNAYTFTVSAVNSYGAGPQSAPSASTTPTGASPETWVSACTRSQEFLTGNNGSTWADMDSAGNLTATFTPATDSFAVLTGNVDLWTFNSGFNQDVGITVAGGIYPTTPGQPEAWKESGGSAGTFSPNAAFVQTVIPVKASTAYTAKLQWKTNHSDSGTIAAAAGPISSGFSPTRLTVQLVPTSSAQVFSKSSTAQYHLSGSNGSAWQDMDATGLNQSFTVPAGNWTAFISGNVDLWTSSSGYNQDVGIAMTGAGFPTTSGQPESWKESGGSAGTFSPNAAFVEGAFDLTAGTYSARLQWKANQNDPGTIWAGAGPIGGKYSPTSVTVILVQASLAPAHRSSTSQFSQVNSDGIDWKPVDATLSFGITTTTSGESYLISANADLWTTIAGYNQDLGIMVSGGAYGPGTLVAWKESGGLAGTYSPNAAYVTTTLHLQASTSYTISMVWKANQPAHVQNAIYIGAGPIGAKYSSTWLTAQPLS